MPPRSPEPSRVHLRREDSAAIDMLVEAGAVLASSLDPSVTMRQVAELTVPRLADLCVIDLRNDTDAIEDVAVVARDPDVERGLLELRAARPIDPDSEHPVSQVIRSGEPQLLTDMTDALACPRPHTRCAVRASARGQPGLRPRRPRCRV
jgi:hypothetical protein